MEVKYAEHTTNLFGSDRECGKTHLVLNLLESEYKDHFKYIVIHLPDVTVEHQAYLTRS